VQAAIAASDARESMPQLPELPRDSFHPGPSDSIEPPPPSPNEAAGDESGHVPINVARLSLKPLGSGNTAREQLELRKRRLVSRLVTCRDSFRVLGFLDIKESDRSEIARLMMALDPALDPSGKTEGVAKEPAAVLASASKDQVDRVERLVAPIEDKLLALDDLVTDQALATRVEAGKITAKTLARYGRLLISRRIQAGPRRDRFEWIATALLTRKRGDGLRSLVNAERATRVLELLIGGLPYKAKEQELAEAVDFLTDALERLRSFRDQEEFFESEFFIDVHGYKVTMREQLLSPDFVYLSVAINTGLHNRVEEWIASMERVHNSSQLTQQGPAREQIAKRLRDEEAAVGRIFGVKPRPVAQPSLRPPPTTVTAAQKRKEREKQDIEKRELSGRIGRLLLIGLALLLALGLAVFAGYRTGVIKLDDWDAIDLPGLGR